MKKLFLISLLTLQNFTSYSQEATVQNVLTIDEFIEAFYQAQNNPEELIPFFDKTYYESRYKFVEHIKLRNKKCGEFLEKKLKSKKINSNRNRIRLRYKVKYKNCISINKIVLYRNTETNKYKILYWR